MKLLLKQYAYFYDFELFLYYLVYRLIKGLFANSVNVDLYSASTQTPLTRSDMDHTMLPANNTISAFTPQSQSITAL